MQQQTKKPQKPKKLKTKTIAT